MLVALCGAMACSAGVAHADTASLTFTDAAGNSDPAVGVGRTITLAGTSAADTRIHVKFRSAGGAPCAPSFSSDSGTSSFEGFSGDRFSGESVNGNFSFKKTGQWSERGDFLFCIWLAETSSTSATPFSQTVTFRAPNGSISATVNPVSPKTDEPATVTITGASESSANVYGKIRRSGGASCATSFGADPGSSLISGEPVNGAFSLTRTTTQQEAGGYVICLWLANSSSDGAPIAGPQQATFTVLAPPPPCIVPKVTSSMTLAKAKSKLIKANCSVGKVTRKRNSRRAGRVIGFTPPSGKVLANGARVGIRVSKGRR